MELNEMHKRQNQKINQDRRDLEPFQVGNIVYYRRPQGSGKKLDTRWIGPAVVKAQEGNGSNFIEIKDGYTMKAHRSFMKKGINETVMGRDLLSFYQKRT